MKMFLLLERFQLQILEKISPTLLRERLSTLLLYCCHAPACVYLILPLPYAIVLDSNTLSGKFLGAGQSCTKSYSIKKLGYHYYGVGVGVGKHSASVFTTGGTTLESELGVVLYNES